MINEANSNVNPRKIYAPIILYFSALSRWSSRSGLTIIANTVALSSDRRLSIKMRLSTIINDGMGWATIWFISSVNTVNNLG